MVQSLVSQRWVRNLLWTMKIIGVKLWHMDQKY